MADTDLALESQRIIARLDYLCTVEIIFRYCKNQYDTARDSGMYRQQDAVPVIEKCMPNSHYQISVGVRDRLRAEGFEIGPPSLTIGGGASVIGIRKKPIAL